MSKVNVFIEEHLVRKVEIEVPDDLSNDEKMDIAEAKAKEMYKNEEIILNANDFNGTRLMMVQDEDGFETEWKEF